MKKGIKQVYSILKFDDGHLQILTAEYFNTRFNVINTYTSPISGIIDYKIVDKDLFISCVKKGIETVSEKIGAKLKKVVLVLPPLDFKRISLKVSVVPSDGVLKKKDIARAITNSLKTHVDDSLMVINTHISKYTINGISSRRLPENENCEEAILDIDLLCANKEMTYQYVQTISEAGLEILDLTLNNYAIAKENVSLDNSINQNIILLDIGENVTYLSLLSKGKLLSSEIIYAGINDISLSVKKELHIPSNIANRLIKYNVDFESDHPDDPVFAWNDENNSYSITVKQLSDCVAKPLGDFIEKICLMCKPIIEKKASFCVCGEGSNMSCLIKGLTNLTKSEVKTYYPDTIGVRNTNMCAVYGGLFVYKEKVDLNDLNVNCVDISEYERTVGKKEVDVEGETITQKIKNLFEMYKDREDI